MSCDASQLPSYMIFIFMHKLILGFALIWLFRWRVKVFFILMVLQKGTQEKQVLELCLWLKMVEWYNQILTALEKFLVCGCSIYHWVHWCCHITMKVSRIHEGLGVTTNNVAEYRALTLGLKEAIDHGFESIKVYGDSKLVTNQVWPFHYK